MAEPPDGSGELVGLEGAVVESLELEADEVGVELDIEVSIAEEEDEWGVKVEEDDDSGVVEEDDDEWEEIGVLDVVAVV